MAEKAPKPIKLSGKAGEGPPPLAPIWQNAQLKELVLNDFGGLDEETDGEQAVNEQGFNAELCAGLRTAAFGPCLQSLDLSRNNIATFASDEVFRGCSGTSMTYLNLEGNRLTYLPASLLCLEGLQVLIASNNQLTSLPDVLLQTCEKLETLKCDSNLLTTLPGGPDPSTGAMSSVKTLSCAYNKLVELPAWVESVTALDASENSIRKFPFTGEKLKSLNLGGNPLSDNKLAKAVAESESKGIKAILAHLRGGVSKRTKKKASAAQEAADEDEEWPECLNRETVQVLLSKSCLQTRPYWRGIVVENVDFARVSLDDFLRLQLDLQKNRRQIGIGSHDLGGLSFPLQLMTVNAAAEPEVVFQPLFETESQPLQHWIRTRWPQDPNRANYAKMVDESNVAVLRSADDSILSVYPVSNCARTANIAASQNLLLEVSGVASLARCDEALIEMVNFLHRSQPEGLKFRRVQVTDFAGRHQPLRPSIDFFRALVE
mmetsp:Transcript_25567/g.54234  ORF Transcript_25567/g.54234 Transcript_25567/m.54234 type:complete len:489 (+) Transcript_25567:246-1712(+)